MTVYQDFLSSRSQLDSDGFEPSWMPNFLYDFQSHLTDWSVRHGRSAIFADCGLGKSPMQLVWAENVVRHTNRPVLIATPLAVGQQIVREGEKFGIACEQSRHGEMPTSSQIVVTNYEQVHKFDPSLFAGMVCDESSILKNFNGKRRGEVTEFMRRLPYRLLCTATAAPNDYTELGTSSEALGYLGHVDMLNRFFRNQQNTTETRGGRTISGVGTKWRFKGHAEQPYWRWVCSWARALRLPSDLGFDDADFKLEPYTTNVHEVKARSVAEGFLFEFPAVSLAEQRQERRRTIQERCEKVAELVDTKDQALVWCHLNDEGDLLEQMIPDARQVSGAHSDDVKESRLRQFADGDLRVLVTKPRIGAWGLNLQKCAHVVFFPSHSYEQFYQGIRRCWRFGQDRHVTVDVVATEGDRQVLNNLQSKSEAASKMFESLVGHMNDPQWVNGHREFNQEMEVPKWL